MPDVTCNTLLGPLVETLMLHISEHRVFRVELGSASYLLDIDHHDVYAAFRLLRSIRANSNQLICINPMTSLFSKKMQELDSFLTVILVEEQEQERYSKMYTDVEEVPILLGLSLLSLFQNLIPDSRPFHPSDFSEFPDDREVVQYAFLDGALGPGLLLSFKCLLMLFFHSPATIK